MGMDGQVFFRQPFRQVTIGVLPVVPNDDNVIGIPGVSDVIYGNGAVNVIENSVRKESGKRAALF